MMKNKFLSPELTRLAIVICVVQLAAKIMLAMMVVNMCYANNNALDKEIQRNVDSELAN